MFFHLRRYYFGLQNYKKWFWLVLLLPVVYLAVSSITPNQFAISQAVRVTDKTPVAQMTSPVGYLSINELISRPELLFQNKLAVRSLYNKMYSDIDYYRTDPDFRALFLAAKHAMSLAKDGGKKVRVIYTGPDRQKGLMMVEYYSERLIENISEGIRRAGRKSFSTPKTAGAVQIKEHRIILESGRMKTCFRVAILSFLGVLILIGLLEYRDSSFKSERQMARYLDVPILGSIPDLNKVYAFMEGSG